MFRRTAALVVAMGWAGCFRGEFTQGQPCDRDRDCGPKISCIDGVCGGAESSPTGGAATEADASSGASCSCEKLDLLIVIDNKLSESTGLQFGLALSDTASELASFLDGVCSYHVGVTSAAPHPLNPEACRGLGSLTQVSRIFGTCEYGNELNYISEDSPLGEQELTELLRCAGGILATDVTAPSTPAEAAIAALAPEANAPGGCNDGFARPDAKLVVVFVTDHDDESTLNADAFYSQVLELRLGNADNLYAAALAGPASGGSTSETGADSTGTTGDAAPECNTEPTPRILDLMSRFGAARRQTVDLCADLDSIEEFFRTFIEVFLASACPGG